MIKEEDAAKHVGLPPEQRFYLTERLARERLADARREADSQTWPAYDDHDYMIEVMAAAEAFGITELEGWQLPSIAGNEWQAICRNFRAEATRVSQKLMFKYAGTPQHDPNTVALDAKTKERLRFHLGQVRSIIDKDPMPSWKKEDLYSAIAELEREIDKARTRIAAVIDVLGKAWDGEIRAGDALRQVITIMQRAKAAEQEQPTLPAPTERKRLEGPRLTDVVASKQKQKAIVVDPKIDDEIPF